MPRLPKKDEPPRSFTSDSTLKGRRIVFVLFNLELGGAERQALILARHLVEHEQAAVEVWGFNKPGPVAQLCEQLGVAWRLIPYPLKADLSCVSPVSSGSPLRCAVRPDILLPYTFVPNVLCGLIWKWTGARACVWNQRDEGVMRFVSGWARSAARRTPAFISNGESGARFLVETLNVDPAKVRVIENGIEQSAPKNDRHAWRARLEIGDDSFVACMVANLHDNKDHRTLLKAWRRVVDQSNGQKRVLVLAGHDDAYESLAVWRTVGPQRRVRFAGQVLDVPGLLSAADLGVFSSV